MKKICPWLSTISIRYIKAALQGESIATPSVSLQTIGMPGASTQPKTKFEAEAILIPNGSAPEGHDPKKTLDIANLKVIPEPLSAPCAGPACMVFCEEHQACTAGGACQECQLQTMTQAFMAALSGENARGLTAARELLTKATENFEEHTKEGD